MVRRRSRGRSRRTISQGRTRPRQIYDKQESYRSGFHQDSSFQLSGDKKSKDDESRESEQESK